jgi:hypothetical protein
MCVLAPGRGPGECSVIGGPFGVPHSADDCSGGELYPQTENETLCILASPGGLPGTRVTSLGWSFADEYCPRHHARHSPSTHLSRACGGEVAWMQVCIELMPL